MDQVLFDINYNLSSEDREYVINYLHDNVDDIVYKIYDMDIGGYTRWLILEKYLIVIIVILC